MRWSWNDLQRAPDYIVDAIIAKMKATVEQQKQALGKKKRH